MNKGILLLVLLLVVLVAFSLFANINILQQFTTTQTKESKEQNVTSKIISESHVVKLKVPAVQREPDGKEKGVIAELTVEARPGKGKVLVEIGQLFFFVDTQNSIRIAQEVAQNLTKVDLSNLDLIYSVETNASAIGGPSAGAALAVGTIAAVQNKTVNPDVIITGGINPDGTISAVGGILEKGVAAKDVGAKLFLVPKGQGVEQNFVPNRDCHQIGLIRFCQTTYKLETVDISKDVGIQIKEVSDVQEALKYFLT